MNAPILITGVGKRAGNALAHALLNDDYPIIGTYRTARPSISKLTQLGAELYQVDFYKPEQVTALIEHLQTRHSRLRALIHNASDWLPDDHPVGQSEVFRRMMTVHAFVPFLFNSALAALLHAETDGGSDIIHLTDYVAESGSQKHSAYAASKAALANLTLSFAARLAPQVKVNAIAPALLKFNDHDDEAYRRNALNKAVIPHEGGFSELIAAVRYLLSSRYITGRTLHLDGGRQLR